MPTIKSHKSALKRFDFKPGTILYLYCDGYYLNKDKYFLLLSSSSSGATAQFVINSKINKFIANRPHLQSSQFRINKSDYKFLKYDSFINCTDVKWWYTKEKIEKQIEKNPNRIKGLLTNNHLRIIIEIVLRSSTIPPIQIEEICNSLSKIIK